MYIHHYSSKLGSGAFCWRPSLCVCERCMMLHVHCSILQQPFGRFVIQTVGAWPRCCSLQLWGKAFSKGLRTLRRGTKWKCWQMLSGSVGRTIQVKVGIWMDVIRVTRPFPQLCWMLRAFMKCGLWFLYMFVPYLSVSIHILRNVALHREILSLRLAKRWCAGHWQHDISQAFSMA